MPNRWTSRKFLLSLSAQIAAILVLVWPQRQSEIVEACQSITALVVVGLSTLGYLQAEGAVDKQRAGEP
ncbi:MAG: hypothetical protein IT443_01735 [Phycisphaeraceae bacterium]|nr:hypothetical protein [Phycisphaeraceae bacterium]